MQLLLVVVLNALVNTGLGVLLPLMPILLQQYGFTVVGLSLPFVLVVIGRVIAKLFCGKILILPYKITCIIAFACYTIVFILYTFFATKEIFLILRFVEGLIEGILVVIFTDIAIHLSKKHNRGFYMGIFGFSFGLGMILGPLYGGMLYKLFGINSIFIANALLGLFGVICSLFLKYYNIKKETVLKFSIPLLKLLSYYSPAILRRVYLFSISIFLPIYFVQNGFEINNITNMFAIIAIILTFCGPFAGRLVDYISARAVIVVGMIVMFVCSLLLYNNFSFVYFYIMLICFAFVMPSGMKFFADLVKDSKSRTEILGFAGTVTEISTIVVAIAVPFFSSINIAYNWLFFAGVIFFALLPFILMPKISFT